MSKRSASSALNDELDSSDSESDFEPELISGPSRPSNASRNIYAELDPDAEDEFIGDDQMPPEDDIIDDDDAAAREEAIRLRVAQSQEQMRFLLETFDEEQIKRYETFRRVKFSRGAIEKVFEETNCPLFFS